jgi:tetratricopeptide (TPR) repeat protein
LALSGAQSSPIFDREVLMSQTNEKAKGALADALNALNQGRFDEAIEKAKALAQTYPEQASPANEVMGAAWAMKGDNAKGLEFLNKAVTLNPKQATAITKIGDVLLAEKKYKEAKAQFRKAIAVDPALRLPWQRLGTIYDREGRLDDAIEAYEKGLVGTDPRYVGIKVDLARLYVQTGQYAKCRDLLEPLQQLKITSMEIHLHLGAAYQGLGENDKSLKEYEAATKMMEDPTEAKITLAVAHRDMKRYDKAVEILKRTLVDNPKSRKAGLQLALTYARMSKTAEALAAVAEVEKAGSKPDVELVKAEIYGAAKDWKKAIAVYQGLVKDEKNLDIYKKLITAYQLDTQPDSAEKTARMLPKIFPGEPMAHYEAIMVLGYVRKYDEALQAAKEATVQFPQEPSFRKLRAALYVKKGDLKGAVATAEEWAAAEPGNLGSQVYLASLYQETGEKDKAIRKYKEILAASPEQAAVLNNLALILMENGEADSSLAYSRKAAALAPKNGSILDTYGWILLKRKEHKEALDVLEKANAIAPGNPSITYHLCEALVAMNRKDAAKPKLEGILKGNVPFKEGKDAQELLRKISG